VLPFFEAADLSIVNLEGPLISKPSPIAKDGPVLGADPACVNALVAAGVDVVGLANNHVMDHGLRGLDETIYVLERHGIAHVGAGRDLDDAGQMLVTRAGALRVGVLAMAEHEFGVAGRRAPGVNPLDVLPFVRTVEQRAGDVDFLVVLLHAGNELYPWPRPSLMETCRFLVERGADAVICQHSHCVGCYERYLDATIVYGQGNLIFDGAGEPPEFYLGALLCFEVNAGARARLDIVPYAQSRPRAGAHRMPEGDEERIAREIEARSRAIADPDLVEARWNEFCARKERHYVRRLGAPLRLLRGLDRATGIVQRLYGARRARVELLNLIRCESHREALITILSGDARARARGER
jgi:poly-gamma-glutamate capsule biosynthesis protein CapA/YwtB (metallophosphatase superfamily)